MIIKERRAAAHLPCLLTCDLTPKVSCPFRSGACAPGFPYLRKQRNSYCFFSISRRPRMKNPVNDCTTRESVALLLYGQMCACADLDMPKERFIDLIRDAEKRMQEIREGR